MKSVSGSAIVRERWERRWNTIAFYHKPVSWTKRLL